MKAHQLVVLVFLGLTLAPVAPARGAGATAQDSTAYSQGQAYERFFQDHIMPSTCGIVLERPRCLADFRTVQAFRGGDPSDAAVEAWLTGGGDVSLAVKTWNGSYITDRSWTEKPEFAWWNTAGQVSVAASLPVSDATTQYLAHFSDLMAAHASAAPAEFQGLMPATGTPFERLRPLQAALLRAMPADAFPVASFAGSVKGDVQLGVYLSTLQELIDNPLALSRPESRAFGLIVTKELQDINDTYKTGASFSLVAAALSGDIPATEPGLNAMRDALAHSVTTQWPIARREAIVLGGLTAQVAYNAAVLRDPQIDASFRSVLAALPAYEGMSPRVRADLEALKSIPHAAGNHWHAINSVATQATTDMAASP
jgi:hypothetical protein